MSDEEPKYCSVHRCNRIAVTRGWCQAHYLRWRRTGETNDARKIGARRNTACEVESCDRVAVARGLCSTHYGRLKRTGRVDAERPIGARASARKCSIDGCAAIATERGWCHGHYLRWIRLGDTQDERPLSRRVNFQCTVDGCDRPADTRGLCRTHANRKRKHGNVHADTPIRELVGRNKNHGYWRVTVPPELRHLTHGRTNDAEHRLEMAKLLGRPLRADESVHHVPQHAPGSKLK